MPDRITQSTLERTLLKSSAYLFVLFFLYIFLPVYLTSRIESIGFKLLLVFYLAIIFIINFLFRKYSRGKNSLRLKIQDLQEKINILNDKDMRESRNRIAIEERINRYRSLKGIIEEINKNLSLEAIADSLTRVAFSLVADNQGSCILYLADSATGALTIFKSKKEEKKLIIKAKEGDIFDLWVLRHASPLFIEDAKKDFRFDTQKIPPQETRPVSSLISAPLISENKFLGLLRLDNNIPGFYAQDDLRFLVTVCDIGAVAIENGQLFEKTQELAIHDELTGLYTKGYFLKRLEEECQRAIRKGEPFSLLMLDIDYFKHYNDEFGHTAGDIVLKSLSQNMVEFLKDFSPVISRFGGEEFCIVLGHLDKKKAVAIAEDLRGGIEKIRINLRGKITKVTVSIGVAAMFNDGNDCDEIIFKADRAMYQAKKEGRNRVVAA